MSTSLPSPVIAIHGGAGTLSRSLVSDAQKNAYHAALNDILVAGQRCLAEGGSALDAVALAVSLLEDCPLFNAGHGAVFTRDETHELDAAVMDGDGLRAGAVACVTRIKHPVYAARAVMEKTSHVLLVGAGAETFARLHALEMVEPAYFSTDFRREQLQRARAEGRTLLDHDGGHAEQKTQDEQPLDEKTKFGTVGAIALDAHGHLAAATSTGGMTNKLPGRVGDSPLIGAGTYADDRYAAISCTGSGEMFIRAATAYDVCARMAYAGQSLHEAAHAAIFEGLTPIGGSGGLIAIDHQGNVCLPFNSEGMYRGHARVGEAPHTAIYR